MRLTKETKQRNHYILSDDRCKCNVTYIERWLTKRKTYNV